MKPQITTWVKKKNTKAEVCAWRIFLNEEAPRVVIKGYGEEEEFIYYSDLLRNIKNSFITVTWSWRMVFLAQGQRKIREIVEF